MSYISKRALSLKPYVPGEQPKDMRYIKLNTNENAYPPSPRVFDAIAKATDNLRLYPPPNADALVAAIAKVNCVPADWVFTGNGSDEVLAFAFQAFFDPDIGVIAPVYTYSFYPVYAQLYGIPYFTAPMGEVFEISPESLMRNCPIMLANPNAPSGRAMSISDIRLIAQHTHDNKHVLIVDEAYVDFGADSAQPLIDEFDNIVVIRTLSKSHALAGLRVGYALAQPPLIAALNAVKNSFNSYTLDALAIAGGAAALNDSDYYATSRARIMDTRENFCRELTALNFVYPKSAANFVFARHENMSGDALFTLLKQHCVLVRHFNSPALTDFLRITIGIPQDMDAVLSALREILQN